MNGRYCVGRWRAPEPVPATNHDRSTPPPSVHPRETRLQKRSLRNLENSQLWHYAMYQHTLRPTAYSLPSLTLNRSSQPDRLTLVARPPVMSHCNTVPRSPPPTHASHFPGAASRPTSTYRRLNAPSHIAPPGGLLPMDRCDPPLRGNRIPRLAPIAPPPPKQRPLLPLGMVYVPSGASGRPAPRVQPPPGPARSLLHGKVPGIRIPAAGSVRPGRPMSPSALAPPTPSPSLSPLTPLSPSSTRFEYPTIKELLKQQGFSGAMPLVSNKPVDWAGRTDAATVARLEKEASRMRHDLPPADYDVSLASLHNACRYGKKCFRVDCYFAHPDTHHVCSRGEQCYLANSGMECTGQHPPLVGLCRYGNGCYRANCRFAHSWDTPPTEASRH